MRRLEDNRAILGRLIPGGALVLTDPPRTLLVHHERSRSGASTIRLDDPHSGKGRYIHSRYDPVREAQRVARRQAGFLVVLGFGCGYFAAEAARRPEVAGVLAVEPLEAVLATVASKADLSHLAEPPEKLRLLRLSEPGAFSRAVAAFYTPALHDSVSLHVTDGYDSLIELSSYRRAFQEGVARAAGNYRTMARLGRGWSSNILTNANLLASGTAEHVGVLGAPEEPVEEAVLLGAGPGLEEWIQGDGASQTEGSLVLAADTALPALGARGIVPDVAASIDSQPVTYLHYMPSSSPLPGLLIADLTVPSFLSRLQRPLGLFSGGHPLSAHILSDTSLLNVSTEGGNVGFTLLSAAAAFGAGAVTVVGVDYAYLRGRAYARGTYLDSHFLSRTRRVEPITDQWSRLLYRDSEFARLGGEYPWSYTDPRLQRFADSFNSALSEKEAEGMKFHRRDSFGSQSARRRFHTSSGKTTGEKPLPTLRAPSGVAEKLAELSEFLLLPVSDSPHPPWQLSPLEGILLPLAAWCREHPEHGSGNPFERAREITLAQLAKLGR